MGFNRFIHPINSPSYEGETKRGGQNYIRHTEPKAKYLKQKVALIQMLEILRPDNSGFRMTLLLFLMLSSGFSQSYWVKYGWQAFNSAGDARILALGGAAVTDFGTSISPLFNPAASGKVGIHNLNYTHQSQLVVISLIVSPNSPFFQGTANTPKSSPIPEAECSPME